MNNTIFVVELKDTPNGENYEVQNIYPYDIKYVFPQNKYFQISASTAEAIIKPLKKGLLVTVDTDVIEDNKPIQVEHFKVTELSSFKTKKASELARVQMRFNAFVSSSSMLEHFAYFSSAILLSERGFMITDSNREEKYLEIINEGDEYLLKTLEDYLEARDRLAQLSYSYKDVKDYMKKVRATRSLKALNEVKKETPI
jgi:hypothetical protein